jgi:sulfite reductase (ferredoxin)
LEPKKDREVFAAFSKHLIEPGWVKSQTQQFLNDVIDWRMGERKSIADLLPHVQDLTKRVEELFLSLDANLQFKTERVEQRVSGKQAGEKRNLIDLRGVACPLNFVKAKLELEKVEVGEVLDVLLDEGEPVRNVPVSFTEQGHDVENIEDLGAHFCVKVRRKR